MCRFIASEPVKITVASFSFAACRFNAKNVSADEVKGVEVQAKTGETVKARWLITCAGLQSDYVGKMAGGAKGPTVLPFRGTYHELRPEFRNLIKRNIYPVPDPA